MQTIKQKHPNPTEPKTQITELIKHYMDKHKITTKGKNHKSFGTTRP